MWAAAAMTMAPPVSAQLIQRKDLSLPVALTIAQGALDACKAMGYAASEVVVDRSGSPPVSLRGDDSGPHTVEDARRKAYTANAFKMTTEAFVQEMKTRPMRGASRPRCRASSRSMAAFRSRSATRSKALVCPARRASTRRAPTPACKRPGRTCNSDRRHGRVALDQSAARPTA